MDNEKLIEAVKRGIEAIAWSESKFEPLNAHDDADALAQAALAAHNAALEAASFMVVPGWRDIADAPRDGTVFLIDAPDVTSEMTMATYEKGELVSIWDGKPFGRHVSKPRHFMPLPAAPNAGRG